MDEAGLAGRFMLGVATLTSIAYAWRRRDRQHLCLAAFFAFTLLADLVRLQLVEATPGSSLWFVNALLGIAQMASVPVLAALILAKRLWWLPLIGWVVAAAILGVYPHRAEGLFKASDMLAAAGAVAYIGPWARLPSTDKTLAELAALSVIGVLVVGVLAHRTLGADTYAWRVQSAAIACILAGIVVAQLRGTLT